MGLAITRLGRLAAVVGCCSLALGGCEKKSGEQAYKGQVVAHVGDQVVTTQEVENEFRRANVPADKQKDPETVKRVLGEIVSRKYLLQQALNAKLDQEPGVLLDLIRAREQVLEAAFLARGASAKAPGKADVDRYIINNPSKFANRKVFNIEQIGFAMGPLSQTIIDANKDAKSLDEVDQKLTIAQVPHGRQAGLLSTAEISPDLYHAVEARKPDDIFFVRVGATGVFFKVLGEESRPLVGEAAANTAKQLMRAESLRAETVLAAYSANLQAKYQGEYAKIMQQGVITDGKN